MARVLSEEQQAKARARAKAWYIANKERALANVRAYAAKNQTVIAVKSRAYREANKDTLSAYGKAWYQAHREERIAYQKSLHTTKADVVAAYKKEWWIGQSAKRNATRRANKGHASATFMKWYHGGGYARHREKFLARNARRRALRRGAVTEPIDYMKILRDSNGLCGICKQQFDLFGIDFDHIVPLAVGGPHVESNLQATHARCNRSKGATVS